MVVSDLKVAIAHIAVQIINTVEPVISQSHRKEKIVLIVGIQNNGVSLK